VNAPQGGTMPWTEDLDQICSYLTSVRMEPYGTSGKGIKGAVLMDDDGLVWGQGANCAESFLELAPRALGWLQESAWQARRDSRPDPDFFLVQDPEDFVFCKKFLGGYYVVVSGSRGSFELFQGRIDRCVQMAEAALKERKSP
jgi:hypothetical protein